MMLGKNERAILLKLVPGEFTPPSVYLRGNESRHGNTLNRIVYDKGLAEFRWVTLTPEERKKLSHQLSPGLETVDIFAALRPTALGEEVISKLRSLGTT